MDWLFYKYDTVVESKYNNSKEILNAHLAGIGINILNTVGRGGGMEEGAGENRGYKWWWKETWLGVMNTQYSVQMMCCRIVPLKPV